ncbi:TSUP family transporter [Chryseobacterium sp. Tr-659]|uniref:sulfite exporter TauE/SafE family protein n=1 Tax=Chryseobacterium sp. Tr-659 TaxID=2608340 RepID=UPI00141F6F4D|nr:TSUP family transporter [Chryseobacterium sp. Tr-659]NIF07058.1 TSUP family transporter [Chryseobacterium sp. Tr-659]
MNELFLTLEYPVYLLVFLCFLAFAAGFIDAVVGGGGLIQVPALLIAFSNLPVPTIFGTNKIAALSGTLFATYRYTKKIRFDYLLLFTICVFAFIASLLGAQTVSIIRTEVLKPAILVILIVMAVYVYQKKELGTTQTKVLSFRKQMITGSLIGIVVGFYDGLFGPGTGSFFILSFVFFMGFEFLKASAYAKVINCCTGISALIIFIKQGYYLLGVGLLLAFFNIIGNIAGSRMALKKGNGFVRKIFLIVVSIMIIRYGYDISTEYFKL